MSPAEFETWFEVELEHLYDRKGAGFVIAMVAFPLLERFLRQKSGVCENFLRNGFREKFAAALVEAIPELGSQETAMRFWEACRHGLLHQVTFNVIDRKTNSPVHIEFRNSIVDAIVVVSDAEFHIKPVEFAKRTIALIKSNFEIFDVAQLPTEHPVVALVPQGAKDSPYPNLPHSPCATGTSVQSHTKV